jgi:hypothetical protein
MPLPARGPALVVGSRGAGSGRDRTVVAGVVPGVGGVVTHGVAVEAVREEHRNACDDGADYERERHVDDDPTSCHCLSPGFFFGRNRPVRID